MDGHNSHMIVNFITFDMEYLIDLFILSPHTSHLLQLLDVGVFSLLKCVMRLTWLLDLILVAFCVQIGFQCLFELNLEF